MGQLDKMASVDADIVELKGLDIGAISAPLKLIFF